MAGRGTRAQSTPSASVIHIKGIDVDPAAVLSANNANDDVAPATELLRLLYERYPTIEKTSAKKDRDVIMQALSDGKWLKGIDSLPTKVTEWFYGERKSGLAGN